VTGTVHSAYSASSLEAADRQKYVDNIQKEKMQEQIRGRGISLALRQRGLKVWSEKGRFGAPTSKKCEQSVTTEE
jgi:hypothetical protein